MTATLETPRSRIGELVPYFLRLGLLGFGGPVALVGQMERELVAERGWLTKEQMREAIAVCQSLPGPLAIQVGVFVEVDGMRDADGNIVATRVEGKGVRNPNAADVDELRGVITAVNLGASQFTLGTVVVSFTPTTTFTPPPRCTAASLAPGLRVEVRGAFTANNAFAATRVDCEDLEDDEVADDDLEDEDDDFDDDDDFEADDDDDDLEDDEVDEDTDEEEDKDKGEEEDDEA